MTAGPVEPSPAPAPNEPPAAAATPPAPEPPKPTPPATDPWADPEAARSEIERLRRENAAARTNAKAQAAEEARKEMAQQIGKIVGLVADEADPAKLAENLSKSQAEGKQARVELAVFRTAANAGADPAALLDSATFLASLASIDPADTAAVATAIKAAVEANPRLAAPAAPAVDSPAPKPPAPNPAQGAGGANGAPAPAQLTEADVQRLYAEKKYDEIEKARVEGRLTHLLGG